MKLLAALVPLLQAGSEFTINARCSGDKIELVMTPKLGKMDPETNDAILAPLQAALCRPVLLTLPMQPDPDEALATILSTLGAARQPAIDQLAAYRSELDQAQAASKLASNKVAEGAAAKKSTDKPGKKAANAGVTPAKSDEDVEANIPTATAGTAFAGTTPPSTDATIDLFAAAGSGE